MVFSHAGIMSCRENECLEESLDLFQRNKACMISLVTNTLSSFCPCLAPKCDRIKDYKDTGLVKIGRLVN